MLIPTPETRFIVDEVEAEVIAAFRATLSCDDVGPLDDFFDLGGDSLSATLLLSGLARIYNANVELAQFFQQPIPAALASLLKANQGAGRRSRLLVPINMPDCRVTETPLLVFVPDSIDIRFVRQMARELAPRPVCAVLPYADPIGVECIDTVETLSSKYIEEMMSLEYDGPFLLMGYCISGVVALEVARQLLACGREAAFVALVDSPHPAILPKPYPIARLVRLHLEGQREKHPALASLVEGLERSRMGGSAVGASEVISILRKELELALPGLLHLDPRNPLSPEDRRWALARLEGWIRTVLVTSSYDCATYTGRVLLVRDVDDLGSQKSVENESRWRSVVGNRLRILDLACPASQVGEDSHHRLLIHEDLLGFVKEAVAETAI